MTVIRNTYVWLVVGGLSGLSGLSALSYNYDIHILVNKTNQTAK